MASRWSQPTTPPPSLFTGEKERDLVKQFNDELIERIIGQPILYYPISHNHSNFHPLYGESIGKTSLPPIRVYALTVFFSVGRVEAQAFAVLLHAVGSIPFAIIGFIYFLRSQKLSFGDTFHFLSASEKKIREVGVNITGKESINVSAGSFDCLKVEPVSSDGVPLLKNNGELRVWLSNDDIKMPVKIEMKTNVGTMVMKLKEIKHIY